MPNSRWFRCCELHSLTRWKASWSPKRPLATNVSTETYFFFKRIKCTIAKTYDRCVGDEFHHSGSHNINELSNDRSVFLDRKHASRERTVPIGRRSAFGVFQLSPSFRNQRDWSIFVPYEKLDWSYLWKNVETTLLIRYFEGAMTIFFVHAVKLLTINANSCPRGPGLRRPLQLVTPRDR